MTDIGYCASELSWGPLWGASEAEVRKVVQAVKDLGGSRIRIAVQEGTIAETDLAIRVCVEAGIKPLLCLISNKEFGFAGTPESFGTMCRNVATRYGVLGVGVFRSAANEYQILNEANSYFNLPPGADDVTYVKYLRAGSREIKAVHSSATVIAGGTTAGSFVATESLEWYRRIIAAGAADACDAFAVHFYIDYDPAVTSKVWQSILDVRALMVSKGIGNKKIWITEVGVAYPFPGVTSLVQARDRLKSMIDLILAQSWMGPAFIYNVREYSGGDVYGGKFGMVTNDFIPKSPIYEYAKSLGGPVADPGDITPPTNPTGLAFSEVGQNTLKLTWTRNPTIDGVTNYRIYSFGVKIGDTAEGFFYPVGLTAGIEQSLYVTAVDAAGNESGPSNIVKPTTLAPQGSTSAGQFTFTGSTVPMTFNQLGLGVYVSGGVALPNVPSANGEYLTVWPRIEQQRSPDHSIRISLAGASTGHDRAAGAMLRMSVDGTQGVAVLAPGGGMQDALSIRMLQNGKLTPMNGTNVTPGKAADALQISVTGNVYTAQLIGPGEVILAEVTWVDISGRFAGSSNLGVGPVWLHRKVNGIYYSPPGITGGSTSDVGSVAPVSSNDWALAVVPHRNRARLIATGSWEPFI